MACVCGQSRPTPCNGSRQPASASNNSCSVWGTCSGTASSTAVVHAIVAPQPTLHALNTRSSHAVNTLLARSSHANRRTLLVRCHQRISTARRSCNELPSLEVLSPTYTPLDTAPSLSCLPLPGHLECGEHMVAIPRTCVSCRPGPPGGCTADTGANPARPGQHDMMALHRGEWEIDWVTPQRTRRH
jgi:hypothetical protein